MTTDPTPLPVPRSIRLSHPAFSLVEVVLAMGIVAFALVTIIGLFGGVISTAGDNTERRSMLEAVDAMRGHMITSGFATAYEWAREEQGLIYVTYTADDTGNPSPGGARTLGRWMLDDAPDINAYEPARVGRWVRAKVGISPSNPSGTAIPDDPDTYDGGVLAVLVQMDAISVPEQDLPPMPRIQTTIGISR